MLCLAISSAYLSPACPPVSLPACLLISAVTAGATGWGGGSHSLGRGPPGLRERDGRSDAVSGWYSDVRMQRGRVRERERRREREREGERERERKREREREGERERERERGGHWSWKHSSSVSALIGMMKVCARDQELHAACSRPPHPPFSARSTVHSCSFLLTIVIAVLTPWDATTPLLETMLPVPCPSLQSARPRGPPPLLLQRPAASKAQLRPSVSQSVLP